MRLIDYLETTTQTALAEKLGVTQGLIHQWVTGKTKISAERALQIEIATGGEVSRHDIRPDIFGLPPKIEVAA